MLNGRKSTQFASFFLQHIQYTHPYTRVQQYHTSGISGGASSAIFVAFGGLEAVKEIVRLKVLRIFHVSKFQIPFFTLKTCAPFDAAISSQNAVQHCPLFLPLQRFQYTHTMALVNVVNMASENLLKITRFSSVFVLKLTSLQRARASFFVLTHISLIPSPQYTTIIDSVGQSNQFPKSISV